jgi:hypothetical protein
VDGNTFSCYFLPTESMFAFVAVCRPHSYKPTVGIKCGKGDSFLWSNYS